MSSDTGKRQLWLLPWAASRPVLTDKSVCTWGGAAVRSGLVFSPLALSRWWLSWPFMQTYLQNPLKACCWWTAVQLLVLSGYIKAPGQWLWPGEASWGGAGPWPCSVPMSLALGSTLQARPHPSCSEGLCSTSVTSIQAGALFLLLTGVSVSLLCWNEALWEPFPRDGKWHYGAVSGPCSCFWKFLPWICYVCQPLCVHSATRP